MSKLIARLIVGAMLANASLPSMAAATDLSEMPILMANAVTPAMVMAVDDSGSMDFETLVSANDGALWWDTSTKSFVAAGLVNFNSLGVSSATWQKYAYLFPNGSAADARGLTDSTNDHFAIPPTDAYAWARSADYNPIYYDSTQNYVPWGTSVVAGASKTFANAVSNAARSHPITGGATPTTFDLTSAHTDTASNWTFKLQIGMVAPAGAKRSVSGTWTAYAADTTMTAKTDVAIPYYPATFYKKDATCTAAAPGCVSAPDGNKLRRYEIKAGNTFPSARSYADEMQNFANWFTYYRKRILMLNSSMSLVLPKLTNMRMGMVRFNSQATPTMADFTSSATAYQTLMGSLQSIDPSGGTPTRETLKYIAEKYSSSTSGLIQFSCQRNATMVITDGFAYATTVTPPAYSSTRTAGTAPNTTVLKVNTAPYTTITPGSLADIASSYWIRNIRTDLTAGTVPVNPSDPNPAADNNPDPHINTYALTLGAKGTIYGTGSNPALYPYTYAPSWPVPSADRSPTAVDDLWHATINSRGKMMSANNASDAIVSINSIIADILGKAGAGSAVTLPTNDIKLGDNTAYVASFTASSWYGDLVAASVDPATGAVSNTSPIWSLKATLAAKDWSTRLIATNNGSGGVDFSTSGMTLAQQTSLNNPSATDNATVINYLRGDRSLEGAYRSREYILGDIVDAEPVFVKGATSMVYQAANDGMLHAVDATTGQEVWAYIPSFVIGKLNKLTNTTYSHAFYVDGTPTVAMAGSTRLLVGGLRNGGAGYYALDITDPSATTIADVTAKVKWEFPNSATSATDTNNVGFSYGKPVITPTAYGNVVLVTSGYNNTALSGDGKGHLFVLDPATGAVIRDLVTTAGTAASPSGLAQVAAYNAGSSDNPQATMVYGGDLLGNVWKFDLTSATPSAWSVSLLATLKDASNVAQPITSTPELATINGKPAVYIGTGQLLGASDKTTTQIQSIYMILDKGSALTGTTRSNLTAQTVTLGSGGVRTLSRNAVDLTAKSGWYFDLPAGEKMNVDPQLFAGVLGFNTNSPSSVACSSASYIYEVDMNSGGMMPDNLFQNGKIWAGKFLGYGITSRLVVVVLPSGKWIAINHLSDGAVVVTELSGNANRTLRKVGWREPRF
jgi:type IV pilus assembly protein PilY1